MNEHEIVRRALQFEHAGQRDEFLNRVCGQDAELRRRVEELIEQTLGLDSCTPAHPGDAVSTLEHDPGRDASGSGSRSESAEPFPQRLGHFELLEQIGQGGVGVVYLARDTQLNRTVAVKFLRPEVRQRRSAVLRFVTEAQITGQLQHPGIPPVHQLGYLPDGQPYLVMKLVKGKTLRELLAESDRSEEDLGRFVAIFEQVCHAVGYAHAHRVIHRDLKPSNVMVGAHGEVQVMDWGLAKTLNPAAEQSRQAHSGEYEQEPTAIETPLRHGSVTMTGQAVGTPAYMAPEQAAGELHKLNPRSDVFGLGAILCEILLGRPPYTGRSPHEVLLKAVRGDLQEVFEALDRCPADPELVQLCKQALAFDPQQRPPDGNAVAEAVTQIRQRAEQRARQAELRRAEALAREAEARRRRRVVLGAAAAIILLLLAGIASTTYGLIQARKQQQIAEAQRALAQQNRQKAEANYRQALAERDARTQALEQAVLALQSTTDQVVEHHLASTTQDEANRRFLQQLVERFESLARLTGNDRQSLRIRALGQARVGTILRKLGQPQQAEEAMRTALRLYEQLLAQAPEENSLKGELARLQVNLAVLLLSQGKWDESERMLRRSIALLESVLASQPQPSQQAALALAVAWHTLGNVQSARSRWSQAEAAYRKALQLAQQHLVRSDSPGTQNEIARFHLGLAFALTEQKRLEAARDHLHRALEIRKRLVQQHGGNPDFLQGLALVHRRLGQLAEQQGDLAQSLKHAQQALVHRQRLVELFPQVPDFRFALAESYHRVAVVLHRQRQLDLAETNYRQAVTLKEELVEQFPQPTFRHSLAMSLANLGTLYLNAGKAEQAEQMLSRAQNILQSLVADQPDNTRYREHLLACLQSRAILAARGQNVQQEIACRTGAVEQLQRLVKLLPKEKNLRLQLLDQLLALAGAAMAAAQPERMQQVLDQLAQRLKEDEAVLPPRLLRAFRAEADNLQAQLFAWQGQRQQAAETIQRIRQRHEHPALGSYAAARVAAGCAQAVAHSELAEAEQAEHQRYYIALALENLRQAIAAGVPRQRAARDPALAPLRKLPAFQQLVAPPDEPARPKQSPQTPDKSPQQQSRGDPADLPARGKTSNRSPNPAGWWQAFGCAPQGMASAFGATAAGPA